MLIDALIKGRQVYVRIDEFNEAGITEGTVFKAILRSEKK